MNKITLYEFNLLPSKKQHEIVHSIATFLEVFEDGQFKYALFGLEKFYIELVYDATTNKINSLTTFKKGKKLDKYLKGYEL